MRALLRNRRKIWYANPVSRESIKDEWGNETGEERVVFSDPRALLINVSAASGEAAAEAFGAFTDYSRTLATCEATPIKEGSAVWFGAQPPAAYNYLVAKVADSLNGWLYALKEVDVS